MLPVAPHQGTLPIFEKSFWRSDVWPEIFWETNWHHVITSMLLRTAQDHTLCPRYVYCKARGVCSSVAGGHGADDDMTGNQSFSKVFGWHKWDLHHLHNWIKQKCLLVSKSVSNVRTTPPPWSTTSKKHSNHLQNIHWIISSSLRWEATEVLTWNQTRTHSKKLQKILLSLKITNQANPHGMLLSQVVFQVFHVLFCDFHHLQFV